MTGVLLVLAAIAVLPADRLAMADRLFNRGEYGSARAEYVMLRGEPSVSAEDILFRIAECDDALGNKAAARTGFTELLTRFPGSAHAPRAKLKRALSGSEEERRAELRALDTDATDAATRAAALYHLGTLVRDADMLARCIKVEPNGPYATYANFHRAEILAGSAEPKDRREAVSLLLTIAFSGDARFAEEALYLAAVQSYRDRKHGEAGLLFHRYLKTYPEGRHRDDARALGAWSDYLAGKYSEALSLCGEGGTDDLDYLKAASVQATGDRDLAGRLLRAYLGGHPEGRNRANAELALARMDFEDAEKAGDAAKASESAALAYRLSGGSGDGLRLAWTFERAEQADRAVALYQEIAQKFPKTADGAEAIYRKAMIDLRAERWSPAELALAEALANPAVGRRKAAALYWRGIAALRLGHEKEGADSLRAALAEGIGLDESREARLLLADIDLEAGRTDEARAAYAKLVVEGACGRMSAAKTLAVGKLVSGDAARACARALAGNAAAEWRQAGYALLGRTEEAEQSYAAAIDAYRKAMAEPAKVEDVAEAAVRLGRLESRAGEHAAADATLKRAVELNGANPRLRADAYLALAENALARKDPAGAKGYATVVVTLFDDQELAAAANRILEAAK